MDNEKLESPTSNGSIPFSPELFRALEAIYLSIDSELSELGGKCHRCGLCCDFVKFGHRLYATSVEIAYLNQAPLPPDSHQPCPWQKNRDCRAGKHRLLGCRCFVCNRSKEDEIRSNEIYERALEQISRLCVEHQIPRGYSDAEGFFSEVKRPESS